MQLHLQLPTIGVQISESNRTEPKQIRFGLGFDIEFEPSFPPSALWTVQFEFKVQQQPSQTSHSNSNNNRNSNKTVNKPFYYHFISMRFPQKKKSQNQKKEMRTNPKLRKCEIANRTPKMNLNLNLNSNSVFSIQNSLIKTNESQINSALKNQMKQPT